MTTATDDAFAVDLRDGLAEAFGRSVEVREVSLLAGGASKEAWSVDVALGGETLELLVRRDTGGVIYTDMLSIEDEFRVVLLAHEAGVKAPRPYGYLPDLAGRPAFAMQRVEGETIGRRIVQLPELAAARERLPEQMAEQLALIHSIPLERAGFLPGARAEPAAPVFVGSLAALLDEIPEPHPAIELGLAWLREHEPASHGIVLMHGDFRLGNLVVDEGGLAAVLDWETAQTGDPAADLAWPLVRAWRFGVDGRRLAGVGGAERYLERYNELSGRAIGLAELAYWELAGNVRWALGALRQALRHSTGAERSVELAILGRLAAEIEYEILDLLERAG